MKKGFTLIEMLIVIGIIVTLMAASIGGYTHVTAGAEKAKCHELVSQTATALVSIYQEKGKWPKILRSGATQNGLLTENYAYPLAKVMSLTSNDGKLSGLDKFGIVTPWATAVIKRKGQNASLSTQVPSGGTIQDHILHYALDLDGDGFIDNAIVGGVQVPIRATAVVWSCGKDGKLESYSVKSQRSDDVYSWTYGQTQYVK